MVAYTPCSGGCESPGCVLCDSLWLQVATVLITHCQPRHYQKAPLPSSKSSTLNNLCKHYCVLRICLLGGHSACWKKTERLRGCQQMKQGDILTSRFHQRWEKARQGRNLHRRWEEPFMNLTLKVPHRLCLSEQKKKNTSGLSKERFLFKKDSWKEGERLLH